MKSGLCVRWMLIPALAVVLWTAAAAEESGQANLQWRQVGLLSGSAIAEGTMAYVGAAKQARVEPVQAGQFRLATAPGQQFVATDPWGPACPVMIGPIDTAAVPKAAFDLPIRWLYETDNLVTGRPCAEVGQTFTATTHELAKVTIFRATGADDLDVFIRKDGPSGGQVGPMLSVKLPAKGNWVTARWRPGEVPLDIGKTYYVGIKGRSSEPVCPYLHSGGDIYPGGSAYYDGVPETCSDLGLLIALQSDSAIRSPVLYSTLGDGWVLRSRGVYFKARSANVRAVFVRMRSKDLPESFEAAIACYKLLPDATTKAVGPEKTCRAVKREDGEFAVAAVYGPDEVVVEPGKVYYLQVTPRGEGIPAGDDQAPRCDLLVQVYGEKTPGMSPIIYDQKIAGVSGTAVKLAWNGAAGCRTRINYGLTPYDLRFVIDAPKGNQEADISPIKPGTTACFKLTAESPSGAVFETPVYWARTLDAQGKPVVEPSLGAAPSEDFLILAPMDYLVQTPLPSARNLAAVPIVNGDFEDGLAGWQVQPEKSVATSAKAYSGKTCVQASVPATSEGRSVSYVYQIVDVTPGRNYLLSAYLLTDQSAPDPIPLAELVCDPLGGTQFSDANRSQFFQTGGKWLRFGKQWKAGSNKMTIGVGFSGVSGQATALADSISLSEVKELSGLRKLIGR